MISPDVRLEGGQEIELANKTADHDEKNTIAKYNQVDQISIDQEKLKK
jgi:hypothetical protein